ncbi:MAG: hypothetical protein KA764_05710 [Anaerolineales bacterium]|nr:hypothetical protein [Anaerolineales bacterium]
MTAPIEVRVIGAPVACADGFKDTWREVAAWAGRQLAGHFGDAVRVRYFDLFDADCPPLPAGAQLPVVLVEDTVVSSGGKLSIPAIRRQIEARIAASRPV